MRRAPATLLVVVLLLGACGDESPRVSLQAERSRTASPSPAVSSPTPTPAPTPAPDPTTPTPTPTGPREATDTDRARFVAAHEPAGAADFEDVATDVDGDGTDELVFGYVQRGRVHVDVAWWSGTSYEVAFADEGGEATALDRLGVRDVNGDGHVELVTRQSADGATASASLWRVLGPRRVERLVAVGGCHDGSHTHGDAGVRIEDGDGDGAAEIHATCDEAPLPVVSWSEHIYVWEDDAYRYAPAVIE